MMPAALAANILIAMANNITPKNLRTAINPLCPKSLAIGLSDFNTIKMIIKLIITLITIMLSE